MFGRPLLVGPNQSMPESSRTAQRDVGGSFSKKCAHLRLSIKNVAGPLVTPCLSHIFCISTIRGQCRTAKSNNICVLNKDFGELIIRMLNNKWCFNMPLE